MAIHPSILVRDSLRYWIRKPFQGVLSIFLLALGSAAVTVLWTVTDTIVRQPLPFPDSHQLYGIQSVDKRSGEVVNFMALADFRDFYESQTSFEGMFGYRAQFLNYKDPDTGTTRQLFGARVTRDFADVLKIKTELGDFFSNEDFQTENARSAVISYSLWQGEFDGSMDVLGKSMWFDDAVYQIIGVMPKNFNEPTFVNVWTPFPDVTNEYFVRDSRYWNIVARLKPDISVEEAKEEIAHIAKSLEEEYPATNRNRGATMDSLQTIIVGDYSTPLILILVAVSLVMFATCLNLANIQLISGLQRQNEFGVRQSIGESRQQAFARAFMEAGFISFVGCLGGLLIAAAVFRFLPFLIPPQLQFLPRLNEIELSASLVWTILIVAAATSLGFGLLPAIQVTRADTNDIIKSGESRHGLSVESGRSRTLLLAGQIAVAITILLSALMVVTEYRRLKNLDLGFDEKNLSMILISPGESRMFDFDGLVTYYKEIEEWMENQTYFDDVTSASSAPMQGFDLEFAFQLQGRDLVSERDESVMASYNSISHSYFDALGIRVIQGRGFSEWDNRESQRVAMVNKAFVDRYLQGGEDPLMQYVQIMPWMEPEFRQVVGVVDDHVQTNISDEPTPQILVPATQTPWISTTFVARIRDPNTFNSDQFELEMRSRFPDLGITINSMEDYLDSQLTIQTIMYVLFTWFGIATLLLSLFGIGSQMAFNVSGRSREWGIRLALGATISQLNALVLKKLIWPLGGGLVVGLALFAAGSRFFATVVDGTDSDFAFLSAVLIAIITGASVLTTWIVSDQITRSNPQDILRAA